MLGGAVRIPRSFPCMGHTIRIKWKRMKGRNGQYDDDKKSVYLHPGLKLGPRTHLEQTLCHEMIHCWLLHSGNLALYENEQFVDVHGSLLHQYLVSLVPTRKGKR